MELKIAIVGRPNVGKSTLFNRLTGTKHAIVHDLPGVTRDTREGEGSISSLKFTIIDTPGLEEAPAESLATRMLKQTEKAVEQADLVLMVMDGRAGVIPDDRFFADWLRRKNKPIILVVNKCEGRKGQQGIADSYSLGLGEAVCISAEHGEGFVDLYDAINSFYEKLNIDENDIDETPQHIQLAIVGRPNAGKSTLVNQLLKTERVLTGPEAGITRDSIAIDWNFNGTAIRLIDTAGLRRRSNVTSSLEQMSFDDTLRVIRYAHVVIILMDATGALEAQDITIVNMAIKEGRGLVLAVNKWDLVEDKVTFQVQMQKRVEVLLAQIKGVPIVYLSALHGNKIDKAIEAALSSYEMWNTRIPTAKLNEWLEKAITHHPPPLSSSTRRIRIKYITQAKSRPPTFVVFCSYPTELPDSYVRYLVNSLREEFNLPGVVIRVNMRKGKNVYAEDK